MLKHFFEVTGDSLIYGGIAKNLLTERALRADSGNGRDVSDADHGCRGIRCFWRCASSCLEWRTTPRRRGCRLCWNWWDACYWRILRGVLRRQAQRGAAYCTLWLAAMCPFTAVYAANPLTEGPTLFMIALAMWCVVRFAEQPGWRPALGFTFAVTYAALLRPDGALVALAFAPALLLRCDATEGCRSVRGGVVAHGCGLRAAGGDAVCGMDVE